MSTAIYTEAFFDDQVESSLLAARLVLPMLLRDWLPESVIDVGCGLGTWCAAAMELGVGDCLGLDGSYVPTEDLRIPAANFVTHDLLLPLPADLRADLAICVEVAEHLPPERAESFVRELAEISDIVLFAAAIPYQGGTGHCNEHWLEYWSIMFATAGMDAFDPLRDQIWHDRRIPVWYRQNLIVFGRQETVSRCLGLTPVQNPLALSRVHPEMYLQLAHREPPKTDRAFGHDDWYYWRALEGEAVGPGYGREYDYSFPDLPGEGADA
jgi:SAM-dependent methyltransferase